MKILQVVPRYAPAWAFGGGVRITFELAREWVKRGHEVTVYTSDQQDEQHRFAAVEDCLEGIQIRRFRNPVNSLAARYAFMFYYPVGFARALQSIAGHFDIIHVGEARGPHTRWVARYMPPQGIPFVWSAYGGLAGGRGARRLYRVLYDRVFGTRFIVQQASGLIAQTAHEASIYRKFGAEPRRIHLIPLAVNWSDFEQLPTRGQFRQRLGIGEREKLILFLGRIHWTKGLQVLIPAFAQVARQIPEVRLAIAGWDHGFLGEAQQLVAEFHLGNRVLFPGPIYSTERFAAYVDADLFALTPGVYEETSLAALEACACGTPCVITHQCEIPGVDDSKAGWVVDYNEEQVTHAVIDALGSEAYVRGQNARCLVANHFTISIIAIQHERLFEEVCGSETQ